MSSGHPIADIDERNQARAGSCGLSGQQFVPLLPRITSDLIRSDGGGDSGRPRLPPWRF